MLVGFDFAPQGWAFASGQVLPITQNSALYLVLGATFGGDGVNTFALPNLNGRVTVGVGSLPGGSNYTRGQTGGQESVAPSQTEMPSHSHKLYATANPASAQAIGGGVLADARGGNFPAYTQNANPSLRKAMHASMVNSVGGAAHENRPPFLALNWIIALQGLVPPREETDMDVLIGSLMLVPYDFVPAGFALCNGAIMNIQTNQGLFSLLGNVFGGDGRTTFALPDLRGRAPISCGRDPQGLFNYTVGQTGGSERVALQPSQLPLHNHGVVGSALPATVAQPQGNAPAATHTPNLLYAGANSPLNAPLGTDALEFIGQGQGHENRMPYIAMNWVIAVNGLYPPRI